MKLILLPGLDGTGRLFGPFLEALPDDIETFVISYPRDEKLSYAELVEFVINQLPDEDLVLVGESFSGPIAYHVSLRKPESVKSVIYVATFLDNPNRFLLSLSRLLPVRLIFSLPVPRFIIKTFLLGKAADCKIVALFKTAVSQVSSSVLAHRLREIDKLENTYQPSKTRATYIQATDDRLVPKHCVDDFQGVYSDINLHQVNGPHFILQIQPKHCAEIVVNEIRYLEEV